MRNKVPYPMAQNQNMTHNPGQYSQPSFPDCHRENLTPASHQNMNRFPQNDENHNLTQGSHQFPSPHRSSNLNSQERHSSSHPSSSSNQSRYDSCKSSPSSRDYNQKHSSTYRSGQSRHESPRSSESRSPTRSRHSSRERHYDRDRSYKSKHSPSDRQSSFYDEGHKERSPSVSHRSSHSRSSDRASRDDRRGNDIIRKRDSSRASDVDRVNKVGERANDTTKTKDSRSSDMDKASRDDRRGNNTKSKEDSKSSDMDRTSQPSRNSSNHTTMESMKHPEKHSSRDRKANNMSRYKQDRYRKDSSRSPSRESRYHQGRRRDSRERDRYRHRYSRSPSRSQNQDHSSLSSKPSEENKNQTDADDKDVWTPEQASVEQDMDISLIVKEFEEFEREQKKIEESESSLWVRCSPAEQYYQRSKENPNVVVSQAKLEALHEMFNSELLDRSVQAEAVKPPFEMPPRKIRLKKMKSPGKCGSSSTSSCTESESSSSSSEEEDTALEELERKKKHPYRLHQELWYNDPGEMNDGPLCRCSAKAQRSGIRHGIYPGEEHLQPCDLKSNNAHRLHHYRVTMSPHTNFLSKFPTIIQHDNHEFIFEGFSMFSHASLTNLPACKVIRFNIEYTVLYLEESFPENFTVEGLNLFSQFLFHDILELVDLNWKAHNDPQGCQRFHFMPRFARNIEDGGKELLSMNVVLHYLLSSNKPLIPDNYLEPLTEMSQSQWQDWADKVKGMIVTTPGMKPCSLRVDQLDREQCTPGKGIYPEIVHFGIRPPQLSYAGNPSYQKAWRSYVKFRHLLANKPKVEYVDRHKLLQKEMKLQEMRMKSNLKRDVTVVVSSKGFYRTGVMCDMVQHALLLPVLVCHLRLHQSLDILEESFGHKFKDRWLLQLALTHPSYRENFGTNPDHARNSLTNCGIRQPEYGDRRIHYMNTRKRGINTLINIMSRFGKREETLSHINHNERLEFLGDAVVEFLSSIHLFYMFPDLEEGGLATYRAAIVQNQHLAVLAKKLHLEKYMLYAHGSDLCHDLELRHAMANCFEALMGALFLDDGIKVADKVFSQTLFSEPQFRDVWFNYPPHPLQEQEPHGDRKWIESVPLLMELHKFEEATGIEFTHIRLLARAFTHRSVGFNNLTLGSNQRLEFLGDTVLQLVASEYLYKFFPEHHEGHLSLLRSSLVNNRTQSVVCDDLGMAEYAIYPHPKGELKTKDKADLLEAFLGALYVDKDLEYCKAFCEVCFFPRLQPFIMNQDWNDPKSKLQQCCLTLRSMDGGEPDIPLYKVIECKGPTNTRVYTVAVYFRGERLATGSGHSIQQAEMAAASNALDSSKHLFPQLNHQRRVIERSVKQQVPLKSSRTRKKSRRKKK